MRVWRGISISLREGTDERGVVWWYSFCFAHAIGGRWTERNAANIDTVEVLDEDL